LQLPKVSDTIEFRVGTATWTDPKRKFRPILFTFFCAKRSRLRLRFYVQQFNTRRRSRRRLYLATRC
jgi:hypothetical protein